MPLAASLLPEFDREVSVTRSLLERVPGDKASWVPHAKSTPLGKLAMHVANVVNVVTRSLGTSEIDVAAGFPKTPEFTTTAEALSFFDESVRTARAALAAATDQALMEPWTLKNAGRTVFTMPKAAVIRTMAMNHMIHHRGQLSVYLRLNDVPLPPMYGPTADER